MRADRLIALLLLLQRRGRITAAEAATELEVSARTARRDLEALAMSGVPVYSTHGRGGGWELIGGASTDLSGLSADEARAIFVAAGPAVSASPELKSALRKLTSALPETFQDEAETAARAFKIDPSGWGQASQGDQPQHLGTLTDAVLRGRQAKIDYQGRSSKRRTRTIHPLGLVTKRGVWYLVARSDVSANQTDDIRTFRLSRVRSVEVLDLSVIRPATFDLDDAWGGIVTEVEQQRPTIKVRALVEPALVGPLHWVFGSHQRVTDVTEISTGTKTGSGTGANDTRVDGAGATSRREVVIEAHSARSFAGQIAGFGGGVELLEAPDEVFAELTALTEQLARRYLPSARPSGGAPHVRQ